MGLDVVKLIMRIEEDFSINLPDDECGQMRTVGDLYRLVLKKLNLEYRPAIEVERQPPPYRHTYVKMPLTTAAVWYMVKDIIIDQLQVDPDDIREDVTFLDDLGAD
jgi:acyl carrier protein